MNELNLATCINYLGIYSVFFQAFWQSLAFEQFYNFIIFIH